MRVSTIIGWVGVVALAIGAASQAQAAFDDIEVSPRVRALGGAWAALRGDEYAPLHNPAGLAWVAAPLGAVSYVRPFGFDFSSQSAVAGTAALPRGLGGVGGAIRRFGVDYLGESLTHETTMTLAHGFRLLADRQSEVAVGWSLNLYSLDYGRSITGLDPGSASALGISAGAAAVVRERTRVGFYVLNLNNPAIGHHDQQELPRRVCVGLSYAPYPGVETVLDMASELGGPLQYRGGAELQVADFLWLRAGIHTDPSAFAAGVGLRAAGVRLDYGFSTGGVLEETHHLGIGYELPRGK